MNCPAASGPWMVASEPADRGCYASSRPLTTTLELAEIARPTLSEPSVVPPESLGGNRFDSSEPSEPREGLKRQHVEEEEPGSDKMAPKHPRMIASR